MAEVAPSQKIARRDTGRTAQISADASTGARTVQLAAASSTIVAVPATAAGTALWTVPGPKGNQPPPLPKRPLDS